MLESFESIRSTYRSLDPASVLEKPTSSLLGVSPSAVSALDDVGISTVFDLASSTLFANSVDICLLAENGEGRFAAIGKVPHDVLRNGYDQPLTELPLQPISILSTYSSKTKLDALATALDVASIRDLAAWPPYRTAREFLDRAYNPLAMAGVLDQEAPSDLIPANGRYPTERVQYEVLLFDEFVGGSGITLTPRQLGADGALDVSQLLSHDGGYERPAIGGILTFTQSWYTKALALGNLIHGVALAPGESTKIAMIDWSRRVRTSAAEIIQEDELLASDLSRSRSISEITRAVARETQEGRSAAESFSTATQRGESTGYAGLRDPSLNPFEILSPGVQTSGTSFSTSTGSTSATAWSTSSGQREVGASLAQDIVDRTQQAAHSARNRRASIVREVSQQESETISTRTLTNYNHMHALTVEYYEVVQLYRTVVELSKADRCLFVPMKLVDFTQPRIVDRYRHVIAANGLRDNIRTLSLANPDRLALWGTRRVGPWDAAKLEQVSRYLGITVGAPTDGVLSFPTSFSFVDVYFNPEVPFSSLIATLISGEIVKIPLEVEPGPGGPLTGKLHTTGGVYRDPSQNIFKSRLGEIRRVEAQKKEDSTDFSGKVTVNLFEFSEDPRIDGPFHFLSWSMDVSAEETSVVLFELQPTITTKELTQHLEDNRLYYSQAIWRALDPATIGIMLAGYTWPVGGKPKPLVELVDPTPVAIVANYLVFRMSGDDAEEKDAWLAKKKITVGNRREDLVPVPSGGVFAEAVLGRFNSAEKLDITRFWNWQDSPIPIQAPDIAAIQAGSRRDPDTTTPGQLGAPVLNIVNPPALPDPQGMGAVLAAVQNGNMFRDMSGLAATIGLAQAGLAGAQQGASDAATQAGQNAAVAAQLGAKVAELAAKLVAAYFTGGASLAAGAGVEGLAGLAGGISGQGAKLNHGKDMDKRGIPAQTSVGAGAGSGTPPASDSGTGEGSGGGSTDSGTSGVPVAGNESAAFNTALGGGSGLPGVYGAILEAVNSAILGAAPYGVKPALTLGQKVPNKKEFNVVGPIAAKIVRGTPEFDALVENKNPNIVFKDEEGTGADRMMTPKLRAKLDDLAELVNAEWSGKKLRVTEAWDETNEHDPKSIHYEGRAADITVSDKDTGKLGRLGQLAVDVGFDWVFYENAVHVHVSVTK